MFSRPRNFLKLWAGAFFGNLLPSVINMAPESVPSPNSRLGGKGKGRSAPAARNAAIQKRAAKKAKGRATNKARHA